MNICACGCGQEFEHGSQPRKYYSDACKQRAYRYKVKKAARCNEYVTSYSPSYQDIPFVEPEKDREAKRVQSHIKRAVNMGVPANLTVDEWIETLHYFKGKCAYCLHAPYEVVEHYIPLALGGGTTATNCVPACASCNSRKGSYNPMWEEDQVIGMGADLLRVRSYLHSRYPQPKREIKPILKYPGSKWRIAQWIISQFPEHTMYLEPYCGSAAVFLQKEPVEHEILNDINGDIVNLFRVLRQNAPALAEQINLTPWAREEYELAYETTDDAIEQARRFLVRCWQAHGVRINHRTGWRNIGPKGNAQTTLVWDRLPERLMAVALRLKKAEIENTPALDLIRKYNSPEWLIYADPPYVLDTRNGTYYSHEMSLEDHQELLAVLLQHRGPVVLSGYAHPLYDDTLADWHRVTMPALAEHGKQAQEVLWLNPQSCTNRQLSFDFEIA